MKVYCKRTYFTKNLNIYPINGKNYGDYYAVWSKGDYYKARIPRSHEKEVGVHLLIESNRESFWTAIKEKEFKKHFIDVNELRDYKIDKILEI